MLLSDNNCDHCGHNRATHDCPRCGIRLCDAHHECPECDEDVFVPSYPENDYDAD